MDKKKQYIAGLCIGFLLALGIVLGIILTVEKSEDSNFSLEDDTLNTIYQKTRFPNGSSVLNISSINPLDDTFKPNTVTKEQLQAWGIKVRCPLIT
jgi:hypothetical protein